MLVGNLDSDCMTVDALGIRAGIAGIQGILYVVSVLIVAQSVAAIWIFVNLALVTFNM